AQPGRPSRRCGHAWSAGPRRLLSRRRGGRAAGPPTRAPWRGGASVVRGAARKRADGPRARCFSGRPEGFPVWAGRRRGRAGRGRGWRSWLALLQPLLQVWDAGGRLWELLHDGRHGRVALAEVVADLLGDVLRTISVLEEGEVEGVGLAEAGLREAAQHLAT